MGHLVTTSGLCGCPNHKIVGRVASSIYSPAIDTIVTGMPLEGNTSNNRQVRQKRVDSLDRLDRQGKHD